MRREEIVKNTFHHILLRGSRGMSFMHNDNDRWDCIKLLFYLNDDYWSNQWERDLSNSDCKLFERPEHWPPRKALISIQAFCLHDNHLHLLAKETSEQRNISRFMQRLPKCLSLRYNKKYGGQGSIFQGPYKSRRVDSDRDLQNVFHYINVKNVFEKYPEGGLSQADVNFDQVYNWAKSDSFSSFADYATSRQSPIIDKDIFADLFSDEKIFKKEAREYIKWRSEREMAITDLTIE